MVVGARQNFQFIRQIIWFRGKIELCLNLRSGFCITKLLVRKSQFSINNVSHLKNGFLVQIGQKRIKWQNFFLKTIKSCFFNKRVSSNKTVLKEKKGTHEINAAKMINQECTFLTYLKFRLRFNQRHLWFSVCKCHHSLRKIP